MRRGVAIAGISGLVLWLFLGKKDAPPQNGPANWPPPPDPKPPKPDPKPDPQPEPKPVPPDTIPKTGAYPFLETLPELVRGESQQVAGNKLITRGNMIRDEVARLIDAGLIQPGEDSPYIRWGTIFVSAGPLAAEVPVMLDALRLDDIRVNVSHRTAQQIADLLGVYLLTPKISDDIQQAAMVKTNPSAHADWMSDGTGSYTKRMIAHSLDVDAMVASTIYPSLEWPEAPGWLEDLLNNPGKYWVNSLTNWDDHLTQNGQHYPGTPATNYGWYDKQSPNGKLWQTVGTAHNLDHVDYSQIFRAMGPVILVHENGEAKQMFTKDALTDPRYAALLNYGGALREARHPKIPFYSVAA